MSFFNQQVKDLIDERNEASKNLSGFVQHSFPMGTRIYWHDGTGRKEATVVAHDNWRFNPTTLRVKYDSGYITSTDAKYCGIVGGTTDE